MSVPLALALAISEPGTLQWSAPPGCPSQDEVAALIEQEAEAVPEDRRVAVETIAVVSETEAGTWRVAIEIRQASGELRRELELDSCAAAAEAVALVYALALTDEVEPEPEPTPVVPKVSGATTTTSPPSSSRSVAPTIRETSTARPTRPPPRFAMYVGGGGGVGTLGRGGGHVLAGLGAAWRWVRFGVRVDHAIFRHIESGTGDIGANVSSTTGGLELAIPIVAGPIELLPGVDLRAGGVRARGVGGDNGVVSWEPWVLAGAGVSLVWMAGKWWGVRVGAEVEVPFMRHTFAFDNLEIVQTQRVGGLFWAGPEFRLPGQQTRPATKSTVAR